MSFFQKVACAVPALLPSAVCFAQEASGSVEAKSVTINDVISTNDLQTTILNYVQGWIVVGVGVGLSVLVVYLGWRLIKRFMR